MIAEVETLRREVERLREERDYWQAEAKGATDDGVRSTLQTAFQLSRQEARVLEILRMRPGVALKWALFDAAWSESSEKGDDVGLKILEVYICKLRAKIGKDAIITHHGRGYELSKPMRARINAALEASA